MHRVGCEQHHIARRRLQRNGHRHVGVVLYLACGVSIGARTDAGLIGGRSEFYGPPGDEARVAALAIQNAGAVTPFYSPPEGLPELDDWASLASAPLLQKNTLSIELFSTKSSAILSCGTV